MTSDKTLTCRDCGTSFVFTAREQEFYAQKGFTNVPSRCPDCRAVHKASRQGGYSRGDYSSGSGSGSGYSDRRERQMFPAVCARCGKETTVPFQPRTDKPVYCSDCYQMESGRGSGGRSSRR
ncbi:MAG: zinc-ribbon domain containing protein [Chloroflexi bacterium]|nr:zinc-ribbon domain containing protein [Chloroflexota bacterium]